MSIVFTLVISILWNVILYARFARCIFIDGEGVRVNEFRVKTKLKVSVKDIFIFTSTSANKT